MGKKVSKAFSNPIRAATTVATFGTSELARKVPGIDNMLGSMERMAGFGNPNAPSLSFGGHNPAEVLAQNGGAPLLANIVMGANIDDSLAGFLGVKKEEFLDALAGRSSNINPQDLTSIMNVRNQLKSIQSDRNLRQKAVENVINDFPNIARQSAQARAQAGGEFDTETRKYMELALNNTASKFAAGGGLSSGAANEAFARVGAENAMNKLNYMGEREQFDYNQRLQGLNSRLNEVNALRDFQNTMMGTGAQQGFSANQASLQRQFQGQAAQADFANQRQLADQAGKNALFGAVGQLGGAFIGAKTFGLGGSLLGSQAGSNLFGSPATPKFTNTSYDSFSGRA